jgi:hypothetical protein
MTKSLPVKPSLEHLKNEAKAILKAHKSGDKSVCGVLRHLKQLAKKSDEEILTTKVPLQEVQHALAMEYGFRSWNLLKQVAGTDFRQTGKPTRSVNVEWGDRYEVSSDIRVRIDEVAEFLVRISADIHVNSDPKSSSKTFEGARHHVQRWFDYEGNDEHFEEGLKASTLVYDKGAGQMVAVCMVGGWKDSAGIYEWFVDPTYDRRDMIRKMTDRALSILAEIGIRELHVWREDDEEDAGLIEELGFELTGEVEGGISVDGKGVNVNLKNHVAYDEDGRTWIEGVPKLSWKTNTQSCFVGALSSALAASQHPVSERELNGLTALAFRTRWLYYEDKPAWCPSCPVGECHEEYAATARNTGWPLDVSYDWPIEERREKITTSIDSGMPVLVYDTQWNPAMAYGYEEAGEKILVTDYFGGDQSHDLAKLPPFLTIVQEFTGDPERKLAVLDALRMAVANWHTDHKHNGAGDYWYGKSAFDHWIHDVLHAQDGSDGNPIFVTWWNMDVLVEARQQAALWLADIAPLYIGPAEQHLRATSSLYQKEHEMLWQAFSEEDAFNADPEKWKQPAHTERIAEALTMARDLEEQAIAEIELAFTEGIEVAE